MTQRLYWVHIRLLLLGICFSIRSSVVFCVLLHLFLLDAVMNSQVLVLVSVPCSLPADSCIWHNGSDNVGATY